MAATRNPPEATEVALGAIMQSKRKALGISREELSVQLSKYLGIEVNERKVTRFERGLNPFSTGLFLAACVCLKIENPYEIFQEALASVCGKEELLTQTRKVQPLQLLNEEGLARVSAYAQDLVASGKYTPRPVRQDTILIPLFATPASAGFGQPAENDSYEELECSYTQSCSEQPDFAVRVSGDSMEPAIHDGQIVYVCWANDEVPRNNQLGIYQYDGENYIKQFADTGCRRLVSYNPKYSDIVLKDTVPFRFIGRVVGIERR